MKCYKLLSQDMTSYRGCSWTLGEWKGSNSLGPFCGPGGFHGYEHPLLAVLHNPLHANIRDPRLFEAEAAGEIAHDGKMQLKAQRMRIVREITVPAVSLEQRVAYGIYCAKAIYDDPQWNSWADSWLSGVDRSRSAAKSVVAYRQCKAAALAANAAGWAAAVAERAAEAALAAEEAGADLIACAERAMGVVKTPGGDA